MAKTEQQFLYDEQLEDKRQFKFYMPSKDCPLTPPENLVLSYLIYKLKYQQPAIIEICRWTGLSDKTVTAAMETVTSHHGVMGMEAKLPPSNWHMKIKNSAGKEFQAGTLRFSYYTPTENGPLSAYDALVWSWMYAQYALGKKDFKTAYIATCLQVARKTVSASQERLQKLQFLKINNDDVLFADRLTKTQLSYFASKGGTKTTGTFTPTEDDTPAEIVAETPADEVHVLRHEPESVNLNINTEVTKHDEDNKDNKEAFIAYLRRMCRAELFPRIERSVRNAKTTWYDPTHWEGYGIAFEQQLLSNAVSG